MHIRWHPHQCGWGQCSALTNICCILRHLQCTTRSNTTTPASRRKWCNSRNLLLLLLTLQDAGVLGLNCSIRILWVHCHVLKGLHIGLRCASRELIAWCCGIAGGCTPPELGGVAQHQALPLTKHWAGRGVGGTLWHVDMVRRGGLEASRALNLMRGGDGMVQRFDLSRTVGREGPRSGGNLCHCTIHPRGTTGGEANTRIWGKLMARGQQSVLGVPRGGLDLGIGGNRTMHCACGCATSCS